MPCRLRSTSSGALAGRAAGSTISELRLAGASARGQARQRCRARHVPKVHENHTVRLHGRVIDIPKQPDAARPTYAGKEVVVKHLLSDDYRVFHGDECIAWASGSRPKPSTGSSKNNDKDEQLG